LILADKYEGYEFSLQIFFFFWHLEVDYVKYMWEQLKFITNFGRDKALPILLDLWKLFSEG